MYNTMTTLFLHAYSNQRASVNLLPVDITSLRKTLLMFTNSWSQLIGLLSIFRCIYNFSSSIYWLGMVRFQYWFKNKSYPIISKYWYLRSFAMTLMSSCLQVDACHSYTSSQWLALEYSLRLPLRSWTKLARVSVPPATFWAPTWPSTLMEDWRKWEFVGMMWQAI